MSDDTGREPVSVKRFDWERRLLEAALPLPTKGVALVAATYASKPGQNVHPGEARLARQCGIDVRSVRRHLATLRESGYLTRVQSGSSTGRKALADVYWLTLPDDVAVPEQRTASPTSTGQQCPEPPDASVRPTDHGNSPGLQRSSSLTLAHDKSRADEADDEAIIEDVTERLEAWTQMNYGISLDIGDHRCIEGMFGAGEPVRVIENTVKKRIREWEEVWQPVEPVRLAEASGAPF